MVNLSLKAAPVNHLWLCPGVNVLTRGGVGCHSDGMTTRTRSPELAAILQAAWNVEGLYVKERRRGNPVFLITHEQRALLFRECDPVMDPFRPGLGNPDTLFGRAVFVARPDWPAPTTLEDLRGVRPWSDTRTLTLVEFLTARLDEDEATARAAVDQERPGQSWQWVTNSTDTVVAPGDLDEAQNEQNVSLRSVEEFPTRDVGPLPAFLIGSAEEVHAEAGEHIARHDPARVLAEVDAKRRIIDEWQRHDLRVREVLAADLSPAHADERRNAVWSVLRLLALPYADHPDHRQEWRP